jgi:hypothetical protein
VFFPRVFCSYSGLDLSHFLEEASFSYWEKLGGRNRTVVADSSVKGKHHIMTNGEDRETNYAALQDGEIVASAFMKNPEDYVDELRELVSLYDKIRNLDNFDPNHCPIMEFQTVDGKHFFLQYHKARDYKEREFRLEREKETDEVETLFVRGSTSPEGLICKPTLAYAGWELGINYEDWVLPESEEGSFDIHYNIMFTEVMARRRKLQVLDSTSLQLEMASLAIGHTSRSQMFKPYVSVVIKKWDDTEKLIPEEKWKQVRERIKQTQQDQTVTLRVVSDGENAYVKRLD